MPKNITNRPSLPAIADGAANKRRGLAAPQLNR